MSQCKQYFSYFTFWCYTRFRSVSTRTIHPVPATSVSCNWQRRWVDFSSVSSFLLLTFSCQPNSTALAPNSGLARPLYMYFMSLSCSSNDNDLTITGISVDFVLFMMSSNDISVEFWQKFKRKKIWSVLIRESWCLSLSISLLRLYLHLHMVDRRVSKLMLLLNHSCPSIEQKESVSPIDFLIVTWRRLTFQLDLEHRLLFALRY